MNIFVLLLMIKGVPLYKDYKMKIKEKSTNPNPTGKLLKYIKGKHPKF